MEFHETLQASAYQWGKYVHAGFPAGPTFPTIPTLTYFFLVLLLFPTFS